jgi:hypothetical protein
MRRKLTSSTRYGEEVEVENQTRNEGNHTYDVKTLLAKFTFRYRPLGAISTYLFIDPLPTKIFRCFAKSWYCSTEISCVSSESKPIVAVHMPPLQRDPDNSLHSLSDKIKSPLPDLQMDAVALEAIAIADDGDYRAREQALLVGSCRCPDFKQSCSCSLFIIPSNRRSWRN